MRRKCSTELLSEFMAKGKPEAMKSKAFAGGLCRDRKSSPLMSKANHASLVFLI
jgi:hypothetical protein